MSITTILKTAPSRLPQYEELDLSDNVMYPQQVRPIVRDIKLVNFYGNEQLIKTGRGPRFRIRYDQITSAQLSQIEKWEQGRIPVTFNGNYDGTTWLLYHLFRAARDGATLAPLIELSEETFTHGFLRTTTNSNASYILDDRADPGHDYVADDIPRFMTGWHGYPGLISEPASHNLVAPSHPVTADVVWQSATGTPSLGILQASSHYTGVQEVLRVQMDDTEAIEWQSPIYSSWLGGTINDDNCSFSVYLRGQGTVRLQANNSLVDGGPINGTATALTGEWQRFLLEDIPITNVGANRLDIEIQNNSGSPIQLHVGGAQLEQGKAVTSYIHTLGSTAPQRAPDRFQIQSGAVPTPAEGTIFSGLTHPQDTFAYDGTSPSGAAIENEYLFFNAGTWPGFHGIAWHPASKKWLFRRFATTISQGTASTKSPGDNTIITAAWRDYDELALYEDDIEVASQSVTDLQTAGIGSFFVANGGFTFPHYYVGISNPERAAGIVSWLRWDRVKKTEAEIAVIAALLGSADQVRWNAQFWGREFAVEGFSRNINPVAHGLYSGRFELIQTSAHYQSTPREA